MLKLLRASAFLLVLGVLQIDAAGLDDNVFNTRCNEAMGIEIQASGSVPREALEVVTKAVTIMPHAVGSIAPITALAIPA